MRLRSRLEVAALKLLFRFQATGPKPTLDSVIHQFGFRPDEVDHAYGVVRIDPQTGTYVVRVNAGARERLPKSSGTEFFSDAGIGTLGAPDLDQTG